MVRLKKKINFNPSPINKLIKMKKKEEIGESPPRNQDKLMLEKSKYLSQHLNDSFYYKVINFE